MYKASDTPRHIKQLCRPRWLRNAASIQQEALLPPSLDRRKSPGDSHCDVLGRGRTIYTYPLSIATSRVETTRWCANTASPTSPGLKHTFARHMTSLDFKQSTIEELVAAGGFTLGEIHARGRGRDKPSPTSGPHTSVSRPPCATSLPT